MALSLCLSLSLPPFSSPLTPSFPLMFDHHHPRIKYLLVGSLEQRERLKEGLIVVVYFFKGHLQKKSNNV